MMIPCIDLQDGRAVQLVHGRERKLAVDDVFGLLDRFGRYPLIHVIDLDAAMRKGTNARLVRELCAAAKNARCASAWAAEFARSRKRHGLPTGERRRSSSAAPHSATAA